MPKPQRQTRRSMKLIKRPINRLKHDKDQIVFPTLQFEMLPNEVIRQVFSYLKLVDLLNCGHVSKRFRAISIDDQYLWPKKVNLCNRSVPVGFLRKLLDSGCKYLSLSQAVLKGTLNLPVESKLKYLNLNGFALKCDRQNPEKILKSCYSLQKLSLSKFQLSTKLINITSLQNGKTLKVLDLSKCTFDRSHRYEDSSKCELDCVQQIVENCTELNELSLSMIHFCEMSIDLLVSNLTPKIEKLDLFDNYCLSDKHVKKLVTRCNEIKELNLGGCNCLTRQSLNFIIDNLKLSLVKLSYESTFVTFNTSDLFKLKKMEKLKLLFYDGNVDNIELFQIGWLKRLMPNLWIKFNPGNRSIAIPCLPECNRQGFWEIKARQEVI